MPEVAQKRNKWLSEYDQEHPESYYLHSRIILKEPGRLIIHTGIVARWWKMCERLLSEEENASDTKKQGAKISLMLRGCRVVASYGETNRKWDKESKSWLSGTIITVKGAEGSEEFEFAVHVVRCVCNWATRDFLGD